MAGLLKFLAVFYARETVGTISRGGTARSWNGKEESEVGESAGYGRGKATRLSRGPGLISPHLHPRLLTDVDTYIAGHITSAFHHEDFGFHPFAGLVRPPPPSSPLPVPVLRTGYQNFPLMKDRTSHTSSTKYHMISSMLNDI